MKGVDWCHRKFGRSPCKSHDRPVWVCHSSAWWTSLARCPSSWNSHLWRNRWKSDFDRMLGHLLLEGIFSSELKVQSLIIQSRILLKPYSSHYSQYFSYIFVFFRQLHSIPIDLFALCSQYIINHKAKTFALPQEWRDFGIFMHFPLFLEDVGLLFYRGITWRRTPWWCVRREPLRLVPALGAWHDWWSCDLARPMWGLWGSNKLK